MKKVVLITNIPTPYRVPLFNELSRQLETQHSELHVVFGASGYRRRQFEIHTKDFAFNYSFLDSAKVQRKDAERTTFLYNGLISELRKLRPDAIVVSGFSPATVKVYWYSWLNRIPYFIWNGSVLSPYRKEGKLKSGIRKLLAGRASGAIAYGSKAKTYLTSLGVPIDKIKVAINTVDTEFFRAQTAIHRKNVNDSGNVHLLCIGYLSPRKNIRQLVEVMRCLKQRRDDVVLDLVGDGSERAALEALSRQYGLSDNIRFHGYLQKDRLPALMSQAKLFLFQTDFDVWGLVLNEAMAAGLPVICSGNAGAATDLIIEDQTGFVHDFNNAKEVAAQIDNLLNDKGKLTRIGSAAAAYIRQHATLAISANGFVQALNLKP